MSPPTDSVAGVAAGRVMGDETAVAGEQNCNSNTDTTNQSESRSPRIGTLRLLTTDEGSDETQATGKTAAVKRVRLLSLSDDEKEKERKETENVFGGSLTSLCEVNNTKNLKSTEGQATDWCFATISNYDGREWLVRVLEDDGTPVANPITSRNWAKNVFLRDRARE
jgi:hypothetical protein